MTKARWRALGAMVAVRDAGRTVPLRPWRSAPGGGGGCLGADEGAADLPDDVGGVVPDPADQRRAAGVLVLHAEEEQARGAGYAAPVDWRAVGVQDRNMDPRVVGAEARRPDDRFDVELGSVLEADCSLVRVDGAAAQVDAVAPLELPQAGAEQQVAALG